jgi:hypothetical protein
MGNKVDKFLNDLVSWSFIMLAFFLSLLLAKSLEQGSTDRDEYSSDK